MANGSRARDRYLPDIAYNGKANQYLVVWEHDSGAQLDIKARVLSATGQHLTGEIPLGTGAALRSRTTPAVDYAFTADRYLVVWKSHVQASIASDIEAQSVFSTGGLDGGNFLIATGTWTADHDLPDVAYNRARNEFLVTWRRTDVFHDIWGQRVKMAQGVGLLGNAFPIASQSGALLQQVTNPAVAALPEPAGVGQYLVIWERLYMPGDRDILGQRIKGDNGSLQGGFVDITSLSQEDTFNPNVAANERSHNYVVGWTLPQGATTAVRCRPVHYDGSRGAESLLFEGNADNAALAGGRGGDYLITWDAILNPPTARDLFGQIWGNRVYLPIVLR